MSTWVLLRGLTREHAHWGDFPLQLAQALQAPGIATPDLPGAGTLWRDASPLRVDDMVEACRRQLRQKGFEPPFHLLGLSLGGMVASAWAVSRPEELAACVLVNTSMRPFNPLHRRLRPAQIPTLLRCLLDSDGARTEEAVLRMTSSAPERHRVMEAWLAIRRARPVSRVNALRQLLAAARYRHPGPRPAVPVLVVCSEGDRLVDPRCSRALASHWRSDHLVHPTAGHDLPLDDGPWLAREIARWMQAQGHAVDDGAFSGKDVSPV